MKRPSVRQVVVVLVFEVSRAGGKVEIQPNKVSVAGLKPGADVDLEATRCDVEGDAASGDGGVIVTKDAGEADGPKEAFAIELLPMIEMGSREDTIVAVALAFVHRERGAAEYTRKVGRELEYPDLWDGREIVEFGCVGHGGPPGDRRRQRTGTT